jgi:spore coat polysaccharide biosynthesis protein SpsF (cytidylyltransferase family)
MTRTVAFIQARTSSTRLRGKVLAPLQGRPLILYMAHRVLRARLLNDVVIVTSTDPDDDVLASTALSASLAVYRGELTDVLKRYADAAELYAADEVVRLTGDCPLIDPGIIDHVIRVRRETSVDYASNIDPPTFPDGMDVECFGRSALVKASSLARSPAEREHVTLWMRSSAAGLSRANYRAIADFSDLRLTVDYADDLEMVRRLLERLPDNFDLFDVLRELSSDASLRSINQHDRNEGLTKCFAAQGTNNL